jgi:hypothetical protein
MWPTVSVSDGEPYPADPIGNALVAGMVTDRKRWYQIWFAGPPAEGYFSTVHGFASFPSFLFPEA